MPDDDSDEIALLVLEQFNKLPPKRKPAVRDNGIHEWVPLSGIVAKVNGSLKCLSLATGMKCLPATKLPLSHGTALHDSHAEILAIRALNHLLLSECKALSTGGQQQSLYIRARTPSEPHPQPFALKDGVSLHMYCSEPPCGDASMELTIASQPDASPWEIPLPTDESSAASLPGRAYFSALGTVRRKPSRPDAPRTLSKSCSDKMALRQCTSLLSSLAALLIHPRNAYLSSVVFPASAFSDAGCARSFSATGRMKGVAGRRWEGGYGFREFEVRTTGIEFRYSRREVERRGCRVGASNFAVAWSAAGLEEGLVGGVLQGRKAFDPKGASELSRRRMWALAVDVAQLSRGGEEIEMLLAKETYGDVKEGQLLAHRRRVKDAVRSEALKGWVRNTGDDSFGLV